MYNKELNGTQACVLLKKYAKPSCEILHLCIGGELMTNSVYGNPTKQEYDEQDVNGGSVGVGGYEDMPQNPGFGNWPTPLPPGGLS